MRSVGSASWNLTQKFQFRDSGTSPEYLKQTNNCHGCIGPDNLYQRGSTGILLPTRQKHCRGDTQPEVHDNDKIALSSKPQACPQTAVARQMRMKDKETRQKKTCSHHQMALVLPLRLAVNTQHTFTSPLPL